VPAAEVEGAVLDYVQKLLVSMFAASELSSANTPHADSLSVRRSAG
jgi:hypothetical protein